MKGLRRLRMKNAALALVLFVGPVASTRTGFTERGFASQSADQPLTISASFADRQVTADEPIELLLSRSLGKEEGSLAVIIGQTDLTSLFTLAEKSLRYDSKMLPLPMGESEVTVYIVSPGNEWKELAAFTLRVGEKNASEPVSKAQTKTQSPISDPAANSPEKSDKPAQEKEPEQEQKTSEQNTDASPEQTPPQADAPPQKKLGFDKLDFIPSITLSLKSQPAQSNFPEENRSDRATFTDMNLQMSFRSEMQRGLFNSQTQFDFAGASFKQEALRFGQLGEDAPRVDLAGYLMQFQIGKARYQSGHFSFGTSRHLMNSFSSRGIMVALPLGERGDFALSAMNGTSIVGFGNFFGLDKGKHRLLGSTLGLELLPDRPGGLRVELSALDGWLLPVNSFSEGSVNDAERSQGMGARLLASDPSQRFKLDAGFARSQFTSPSDPLLDQGANLSPFPSITRNARYLDASYDILKDLTLSESKRANLAFGFRHEQVDPLYRSLGASTQADKLSNEFSLTGAIAEINAQFNHARFNDNLADIPSILKSLTRANTFNVGVPTASLFGNREKPSPLLPRLSYTLNRTHQFGAAIPAGGGFEFDLSSIPDQVGTNQAVGAEWEIQKWRLGYRFNHSFQDNRQPGVERADLANLVNGFTVGISPVGSLDLNFDINAESAKDIEAGTIDRTMRFAPTINWRMSKRSTFASNFSITFAGDKAKTKRNRNVEFDMQWSYQFGFEKDRFRKLQGQFFIRYANRYARTRNNLFDINDLQKNQLVNLGLSINLF